MAATRKTETPATRQLAMVFDLNKCIGCQTCSVACKSLWTRDEGTDYQWWCTVNTMPGQGTPKGWESMGGGYANGLPRAGLLPSRDEFGGGWTFNHEEVFFGGKAADIPLRAVGTADGGTRNGTPKWGPNWDEDQGAGEYPNAYYFYLPRLCNHCTHPACVEACPRGAMYKRPEDGIVLRDEERCRGYQFCAEACPYKKIYFNHVRKVSQHCIMCFPRLEQGVAPACVRQCPGRLVFVGYLDDESGPIHKLVKQWEVALPLHPEYGTEPNIFYVPPLSPYVVRPDGTIDEGQMRIPIEYLQRLFGPGVGRALDTLSGEMSKVRGGGKSEILDTLIAYNWNELLGPFTQDPAALPVRAKDR